MIVLKHCHRGLFLSGRAPMSETKKLFRVYTVAGREFRNYYE